MADHKVRTLLLIRYQLHIYTGKGKGGRWARPDRDILRLVLSVAPKWYCTLSSIRRWVKGIFIAGSLSYEYVKEGLVKARATDMEDTIHSYGLARLTIYKQNYPSIG